MTLLVDGIDPKSSSLVAGYRGRRPRVTSLEQILLARAKGDSVPSRGEQRCSKMFISTPLRKEVRSPTATTRKLFHIETSAEYEESSLTGRGNRAMAGDAMHYLDYTDQSIPTTDLPDSEPSREGETFLGRKSR